MRHPRSRSHYIYISFRRLSRARERASGSEREAYMVARGRDLMRFYCLNDVTGPLFSEPVARRETVDSIYRVSLSIPNRRTGTLTFFDAVEKSIGRAASVISINRQKKCGFL